MRLHRRSSVQMGSTIFDEEELGAKCLVREAGTKGRKKSKDSISRNPFFNFLRCLRSQEKMRGKTEIEEKMRGKTATEISTEGTKIWNKMSDAERKPYSRMACKGSKAPKMKRQPRRQIIML
ncbi:hypothetical protein LSTR_LSTR001976 [Laodelphax striatellus]|uniref:HMG box domain-containing protein n=1 Tax=Laodelphax striatellus TaxID=195883 RepID=A0A482XG74_LAOST|nr:hypothetical protein LSTR_LSTR001976 [Laodelphax striatellus]